MRSFLAARALLFLVLFPGTVAGYVPYRILRATGEIHSPQRRTAGVLAATTLAALGVTVLLWCVWSFFARGRGTLAPVDPPRELVVDGPYRVTRNPMYNGVVAALLGAALLFQSVALLWYALAVLGTFHLFVVVYEEGALSARFGDSYRRYARAVPRWGFTWRPYRAGEGSSD